MIKYDIKFAQFKFFTNASIEVKKIGHLSIQYIINIPSSM